MTEFNYSKKTNSNQGVKTYNENAGSVSIVLESIGVLNEQTGHNEIEVESYGFMLSMKFKNQNRITKVLLPNFLLSAETDENGRLNYLSYLNNKKFMVDGVLNINANNVKEVIDAATYNFTAKHINWAQQLLEIYTEDSRNLAYEMFKNAEYKTPEFYTWEGYFDENGKYESLTGNAEPESKVTEKGTYYNIGNVQLKSIQENGYTLIFSSVDMGGSLDEILNNVTAGVNNQVRTFWNMVIATVNSKNVGQKGYTFQSFNISGEKSYLNIVSNLNSLVTSVGSVNKGGNWEIVTPENIDENPSVDSFWYGGALGLNSNQLFNTINGVKTCRLQFPFKANEFFPYVQGTDTRVLEKYRNKYNPLLVMVKPEINNPIVMEEPEPELAAVTSEANEDSDLPF